MDVFEAVDSRITCRWFLDKPIDPNIVRNLITGAARAASSGNLQPWSVHALAGEPLKEIKQQAVHAIEQRDWWTFEREYPAFPEQLPEPYLGRRFRHGQELYGALGPTREDRAGRFEQLQTQLSVLQRARRSLHHDRSPARPRPVGRPRRLH